MPEPLRQLFADAYDLLLGQRAGGHARIERHAADELAHQQVVTVDGIEVVNGLDRGVIQAREHPRFVAEALARRFIVQRAGGEDLDRRALELGSASPCAACALPAAAPVQTSFGPRTSFGTSVGAVRRRCGGDVCEGLNDWAVNTGGRVGGVATDQVSDVRR